MVVLELIKQTPLFEVTFVQGSKGGEESLPLFTLAYILTHIIIKSPLFLRIGTPMCLKPCMAAPAQGAQCIFGENCMPPACRFLPGLEKPFAQELASFCSRR